MSARLLCPLAALALLPAPSAGQARPWRATDYYRLVFVADPQLEPGGRRIAVTVTTVVEDKDRRHSEIWMVPVDGSGEPFRYTSSGTEASNPVWSPDGSLLAFTSRREGSEDNVWFLRAGGPGGEAFQIPGVKAIPEFSPDGQWLLFSWRGEDPDSLKTQTWRNRVSPAAITQGLDPKRFDGRVYTTLPFKGDERGYLAPRETGARRISTSCPVQAASRRRSRRATWMRPIPPGPRTATASRSSRTPPWLTSCAPSPGRRSMS